MARKSKSVGDQPERAASAASRQLSPADTIARIRHWHRQRCAAMDARKILDLQCGAKLRVFLGWSKSLPDAERKAIAERAADMIATGEAGEYTEFVAAFAVGRKPFEAIEKQAVKEMEALAATLPAWTAFGESVRGFGLASLAVIVAEAGDLSLYANPGKLWKRMGLAVMGDVRQGGLGANASKEDWIAHGYNRQRRSRVWNIGDALIKGNRGGEYRTVYLQRKEYELARDPDMKPIKAHRRAQRYMEKRLLRNLWSAWRRAIADAKPNVEMPAAIPSAQAERSATEAAMTVCQLPSAPLHADKSRSATRRAKPHVVSDDAVPAAFPSAQAERSAVFEVSTNSLLPSAPTPAKAGKRRATPPVKPSNSLPAATNRAKARRSANASLPTNQRMPSAPTSRKRSAQ